jgi:adenosylcobyric acid synthase
MKRKPARAVMVLGTTSGAGKSWLATALCRWYAQRGLRVAPFKAQNMSNNARVVAGTCGRMGEIGSAQYFQALAAQAVPDVRMNPVLLKPERDNASQFVLLGQVDAELTRLSWTERSAAAWQRVHDALDSLRAENDLVVIEGAGSPAEINLAHSDFVNVRTAVAAQAECLLVADIDRGGAFAHLYGTHQLMPAEGRPLLRGFVLNRFRGDAALLAPGPEQLLALTGVPTVAVLPMWREHGLPEEDGLYDEARSGAGSSGAIQIAIVAYPHISNLDEFQPLRRLSSVGLCWARSAADLQAADWIVLPGSKHTQADLAWLRERGLDRAITEHAARGGAVLGICGGLQMLGHALHDPLGVEPDGSVRTPGLGLLPLHTRFGRDKLLQPVRARFGAATGAWAALAGVDFSGYEIHQGQSVPDSAIATPVLHNAQGEPIGWQHGSTLAHYAHGMFESPAVLHALFGVRTRPFDQVADGLADFIDRHFEPGVLAALGGMK